MSGTRCPCHLHYVALSRVTSLNGLYLHNLNADKISIDHNVIVEMEQLRSTRLLKPCLPSAIGNEKSITVLHQNVRSLKRHIKDIRNDLTITSAHILLFTECHLSENTTNEQIHFQGFTLHKTIFSERPKSSLLHGIAIYTKQNVTTNFIQTFTLSSVEISLLISSH